MQPIKVKTTKKNGQIFAQVYKDDKALVKAETFSPTTHLRTILIWANS